MSTDTMREYLAEAYRIAYYQQGDGYVSTSALAEVMQVSAPAVTRMVQRLRDNGYLEHEPYRGIILTPRGEREALKTIRKHRIVERFLVDVMKFGWHEVHDYADDLGASVSDALAEKMNEMAGFPRRCPHGEPIPHPDGYMPRVVDEPLHEAAAGITYVISRVNTHDSSMLRYLDTLGLRPGVSFHLVDRAPFNGPLRVRVAEAEHFIGYEVARVLRVCSPEAFELV